MQGSAKGLGRQVARELQRDRGVEVGEAEAGKGVAGDVAEKGVVVGVVGKVMPQNPPIQKWTACPLHQAVGFEHRGSW